jgi:hypothetical protein
VKDMVTLFSGPEKFSNNDKFTSNPGSILEVLLYFKVMNVCTHTQA